MSNNYRIAIWSDIKAAILKRIEENKAKLENPRNAHILPELRRIAADDEWRLAEAERWIAYHQD